MNILKVGMMISRNGMLDEIILERNIQERKEIAIFNSAQKDKNITTKSIKENIQQDRKKFFEAKGQEKLNSKRCNKTRNKTENIKF